MKFLFQVIILLFVLSSCFKGKDADLIVHNARIHVMNEELTVHDAMAIKDGKILETGPEREILNKYSATETVNAEKKDVFPGFHDAHGHIMSLAKKNLIIDLEGTTSFIQILTRLEEIHQKNSDSPLIGRGWDQSLWGEKELPNNKELNELFPNTAVALTRVDGHAMLVNQFALDLASLNAGSEIEGGTVESENGVCTGIITDYAMDAMTKFLPKASDKELKQAILAIQEELLVFGITSVHEAGLTVNELRLFQELNDEEKLKIDVYAMLFADEAGLQFAQETGKYHKEKLTVRSFKIIGDGSLGSRGACLTHEYSDKPGHFGILATSLVDLKRAAKVAKSTGFQLNTHCIGDSTNRNLLFLMDTLFEDNDDHRWRIEHAQVLDVNDFQLFSKTNAFPSVQPTHAVSDMRWVNDRLGEERLKGAYAYRTILDTRKMICLGTDFPVESFDPFLTIHAAVQRKNKEDLPEIGFQPNEAITIDEALKGMTTWAAYASFSEARSGTLDRGKDATFVIFELPVQSSRNFVPNYANAVYLNGKSAW